MGWVRVWDWDTEVTEPTVVSLLLFHWGERSEPHTCGENGKLSIYVYVYMFGTCVFRIYIHPAPFVRDAIFPHCL